VQREEEAAAAEGVVTPWYSEKTHDRSFSNSNPNSSRYLTWHEIAIGQKNLTMAEDPDEPGWNRAGVIQDQQGRKDTGRQQ
jgi:hypothetical protein